MTGLEVLLICLLTLTFAATLILRGMYLDQVRLTKYLSEDNNRLMDFVLQKEYDIATIKKELLITKNELELYKNHSDNAKIKPNNKTHKMKNPKFEIHEAHNKEYYFILRAENGEIITTSETYTTKQNCLKGVNAVINAVLDMSVDDDMRIADLTQF